MAKKAKHDKLTFELWHADRLIAPDWNTQVHDDENVAQIKASIKAFGYVDPIIVTDDGLIVAGVGRLMALKELWAEGWSDIKPEAVPVIVVRGLDLTTVKKLSIALNKIQSQPNIDAVARIMRELIDAGNDLLDLTVTGYRDYEIEDLLTLLETEKQVIDIDTAPEETDDTEKPTEQSQKSQVKELFIEYRFRIPTDMAVTVDNVLRLFNKFGRGAKALGYALTAALTVAEMTVADKPELVDEVTQTIKQLIGRGDAQ